MTHTLVACSQCFQQSNHLCAFKDDDEQSANHRETCHTNHEGEDNPYVDVEQREPGEHLRVELLNGARGKYLTPTVGMAVDMLNQIVICCLQLIEVLQPMEYR